MIDTTATSHTMTDTHLPDNLPLTSAQRRVLEHLVEHHGTRGDATTREKLATALGIEVHHLNRSLNALSSAGLAHVHAEHIWVERKEIARAVESMREVDERRPRADEPEDVVIPSDSVGAEPVPEEAEVDVVSPDVETYTFRCACGRRYMLALGDRFVVTFACACGVEVGLERPRE